MKMRFPRLLTTLSAALLLGSVGCSSDVTLTVQSYSSTPESGAVNSHLILGPSEAILVDGQILRSDAEKVVSLVRASGRRLTQIFLTHAHPDHYLGLAVLQGAFPEAAIVATSSSPRPRVPTPLHGEPVGEP